MMAKSQITPADRIRELNDINEDVAAMVRSAGLAVNALTDSGLDPFASKDDIKRAESMELRKQAFARETERYYLKLQAVVARLRRQAYALEEAKIISPEAQSMTSTQAAGSKVVNDGLGNVDVGFLNSRGNKVGAEKELELIEEARRLLDSRVGHSAG